MDERLNIRIQATTSFEPKKERDIIFDRFQLAVAFGFGLILGVIITATIIFKTLK